MSCAKSGVPKKGAKIPKVSEHDVPKHSEIFAHFFGKCTGGWGGGGDIFFSTPFSENLQKSGHARTPLNGSKS
jgi:hypothetical protein